MYRLSQLRRAKKENEKFSSVKANAPTVKWLPGVSPMELLTMNDGLGRTYKQALEHCLHREEVLARMQGRVNVKYVAPQRLLDLNADKDMLEMIDKEITLEDKIDAGYVVE